MLNRFLSAIVAFACVIEISSAADVTYTWADRPNDPSYDAAAAYTVNQGLPITIERRSTGEYLVLFNRVMEGDGGYAVSKYGQSPGYCSLGIENDMIRNGALTTFMVVNCFDTARAAEDSQFLLLRVAGGTYDTQTLRYGLVVLPPGITDRVPVGGEEEFDIYNDYPADAKGVYSRTETRGSTSVLMWNTDAIASPENRSDMNTTFLGSGFLNTKCGPYFHYAIGHVKHSTSRVAICNTGYYLSFAKGFGNHSKAVLGRTASSMAHDLRLELHNYPSYSSDGSRQSHVNLGNGRWEISIGPEARPGGHVQLVGNCMVERFSGGKVIVNCATADGFHNNSFALTTIWAENIARVRAGGPVIGPSDDAPDIGSTPSLPAQNLPNGDND